MDREYPEPATSSAAESTLAPQEQIEFLQETIESQKRYLEYQEQQLHELGQELKDTNYQLDRMNQELQQMYYEYWTASSLEPLTLAQSKELAQILLASGESATHVVAQLLSAIYGAPVESSELEQRQEPSPVQLHPTATTKLNRIQVECEQLQVYLNNLREQYGTLQDLSAKMRDQREERVRLRARLAVNLQVINSEIGKHYKQRKID